MTASALPGLNACLNGLATLLLLAGFASIRLLGRESWHRAFMGSAFMTSVVFLVCYLVYHALMGSKHFEGTGPIRTVYFALLLTHTVLAAAVPVGAVAAIRFALRGNVERHRTVVRWTLPVWLYVSITGVVIYYMLYRMPL